MMRPKGLVGAAIGVGSLSFEDRLRLDKLQRLESVARVTHADSPWFVLRCWTGHEVSVRLQLEELGINALVPQRRGPDYRRRHRIIPGQMMPVIHGYVLVQMDPIPEGLAALDAVSHAIDVLGGCEFPKRLLPSEVARFNALAESGIYDWQQENVVYRKGDKVSVKEGFFCGAQGLVISARPDGKGDAVIEMDVLGRMVPVNIPLALIEKI